MLVQQTGGAIMTYLRCLFSVAAAFVLLLSVCGGALSAQILTNQEFTVEYFKVKNAVLSEFFEIGPESAIDTLHIGDTFLDCHLGYDLDQSRSLSVQLAAYISEFVLNAKTILANTGYPQPIWRPQLIDLEAHLIDVAFDIYNKNGGVSDPLIMDGDGVDGDENYEDEEKLYEAIQSGIRKILISVTQYNIKNELKYPGLTIGPEGCGNGDDVQIVFSIDPSNGTFVYITEYLFKVCAASGDPYDRATCPDWREGSEYVYTRGGNFRYFARWPDGREKKSALLVLSELENEETGNASIRITPE